MTEKTAIIKCDCKVPGQDALYGAQNRVHNAAMGKNNVWWRCTGCGKAKGK